MTTYRYKGTSSSGAPIEGVVEAFDQQDAVVKARENCRVLISVEPVSAGKVNDILNADIGALLSGGKIKPKTLALLCSQLAIEMKAGLPLVSSLKLVAENEEDKQLKKILNEVADDVHAGAVEDLHHAGHAAGTVGHADGDHLGHVGHIARRGEHVLGALVVVDDHPDDAEIAGVGERKRRDVDACVGQRAADLAELPGLVLEKYRYLSDLHAGIIPNSAAEAQGRGGGRGKFRQTRR